MTASASVHVTGMAWMTALGDDLEAVWRSLRAGETGMRVVPSAGRLRNLNAAVVPSVPLDLPPGERLFRMSLETANRAIARVHCDRADPQVRLVLGTSFGSCLEDLPPARSSAYAWAERLARELGIATEPILVSTACSAGSDAILLGAEMLRAGVARCCVCGGADVLTAAKRLAHSALGTLSPTTLRAFDVRHDGTVLGEGAAFMVLESAEAGRTPLALFRGGGGASDAVSMTAPDTSGAAIRRAMERSLVDAGSEPADIGVINAHASGTPLNDLAEREALNGLFFGSRPPLVFGTKGNFGHSLGATGAIEAIALVLALRRREVPPVVGLEQPDPEFLLPLVRGSVMKCERNIGLSLTLGFGGFDTSLVLEAPP
jgi:3-oxoacyl-[acyl-carrier-protein] synthase II